MGKNRLVFVCFLLIPGLTSAESRPNILFIMSDDHAAHAISAYGSKVNRTPGIDRIGKEGLRFTNCFVTNSICTPSRAAILTGQYAHINGVPVFNPIDPNRSTLAKYLQKAGYYTGMIGKWHLGSEPVGFDSWNILPGQGAYNNPDFITPAGRVKHPGYVTELITDFSIDFLKNRPLDKPFFLMCHHKAPHRNWMPHPKYAKKWATIDVPEPETFNDDYRTRSDAAREATMRIDQNLTKSDLKLEPPPGLDRVQLKKWQYQRYMRDYLACIDSVDDSVGQILDFLDQNGLRDNTIVVYTSDQGFFLGDHNWYDKRFMYEESLRMPFLIRWPNKIKPGTTCDRMILNVDFAPTFLDVSGEKIPSDMQGRSFFPLLRGEMVADWRTAMYYRYYHYPEDHQVQPHYGVRTADYKLIYFNKIDQWELFDLKKDPHELRNLYQDPQHADTVKNLRQELQRLKKDLKDEDQFSDHVPGGSVDAFPSKR